MRTSANAPVVLSTFRKIFFPIALVIILPVVSVNLFAEDEKKDEKKDAAPLPKAVQSAGQAAGQTTEHSFEDLLVQGKYHFSDSAVTTVEEDKVLDSLLGVRSDFKDRIENSEGRW